MLPKQTHVLYDVTIPSTGKAVKFHPFLVRDEKALLLAQESDDITVMAETLKSLLRSCIVDPIDIDSLAVFDLEYLLTKIRSVSTGELVELEFTCDADASHAKAPVTIDLTNIETSFDKSHKKKIDLFGEVGVMMKYPDISMLDKLMQIKDTPEDASLEKEIVIACIDYIFTATEMLERKDQTMADMVEFIDNLTGKQYGKIEHFFETMPSNKYTVNYKCPTCGLQHTKVIGNFRSFFD